MFKSKVKIIIAIIVIIIIICVGIGIYFYNEEIASTNLINKVTTEMNNKNYEGALNECNVILNGNPNNTEAKEIKCIITDYEKAKTDYSNKNYTGANTTLSNINLDYTKYGIAEDINKLKEEVKSSELAQSNKESEENNTQNNNINSNNKNTSQNNKNTNTVNKNINSNSQNKISNNKQNSKLREQYLSQLNKMSSKLDNSLNGQQDQIEMDVQSGKVYDKWNNKLNEIWGVLKENLPASEMNELTSREVNWIKEKDQKIKEVEKQYQGGSIMPLEVNCEAASLTEQRCYYLVNNYM